MPFTTTHLQNYHKTITKLSLIIFFPFNPERPLLKQYRVSNGEIAEKIFKDGNYKALCRSIAKKAHIAEELHSEFIMLLLETKDNRLIEASEGGYLDVYCVGMIRHLWARRRRAKSYVIGTTSPLFEYSSTYDAERGIDKNMFTSDYNVSYDYVSKEVMNRIREDMDSDKKDVMYKSRVFYYSHFKYKNPMRFAKKSGIPYRAVIDTYNAYKKKLNELFKNKIND